MIVAISGKIGSGKDTFANRFIKEYKKQYGIQFKNKKFGYNLKKIVSVLTGVPLRVALSREGKLKYLPEWGMTVGEMQQKLGTEGIRNNVHNDAWVLSLFGTYNDKKDNWIISDCRFLNEANIVKQKGGILIRLNGDPKKCRENEQRNLNHQSEIELDNYQDFDYIFDNIAPISNLDNFIKKIIADLNKK